MKFHLLKKIKNMATLDNFDLEVLSLMAIDSYLVSIGRNYNFSIEQQEKASEYAKNKLISKYNKKLNQIIAKSEDAESMLVDMMVGFIVNYFNN